MKWNQFFCLVGAIALSAACGETPDADRGETTNLADSETANEDSFDLSEYGFIDGGEVVPIAMPDWLPANLTLPDDFIPVQERAIGTKTFMLRGVTKRPQEGLFDSLSGGLREAGYEVRDGDGYRADNLVYFSGNGYQDSTIKIRSGQADTLLEIGLVRAD